MQSIASFPKVLRLYKPITPEKNYLIAQIKTLSRPVTQFSSRVCLKSDSVILNQFNFLQGQGLELS